MTVVSSRVDFIQTVTIIRWWTKINDAILLSSWVNWHLQRWNSVSMIMYLGSYSSNVQERFVYFFTYFSQVAALTVAPGHAVPLL